MAKNEITLEQKKTANQSFINLLYDVNQKDNPEALLTCWTPKDIENIIYFINLRMAQRQALISEEPLSLRCALVAN